MPMIAPQNVRWPKDERLVVVAAARPVGWWKDHAATCVRCRVGEPGCDLGEALSRLHTREFGRELARRV